MVAGICLNATVPAALLRPPPMKTVIKVCALRFNVIYPTVDPGAGHAPFTPPPALCINSNNPPPPPSALPKCLDPLLFSE